MATESLVLMSESDEIFSDKTPLTFSVVLQKINFFSKIFLPNKKMYDRGELKELLLKTELTHSEILDFRHGQIQGGGVWAIPPSPLYFLMRNTYYYICFNYFHIQINVD